MFYIKGNCPICREGTIGFRKCSDKITIVLMCNECDSVWLSPNIINEKSVIYPKSPDFVVDGIGCSIAVPLSQWAEKKDVEAKGWGQHIKGEGRP